MKQPPPVTQFPTEFSITAYDVCTEWGVKEWTAALSVRMKARNYWRLAIGDEVEVAPPAMVAAARKLAIELLSNLSNADSTLPPFRYRQSAISDQSVAEFFSGCEAIDDPIYSDWADGFIQIMKNRIEFEPHDDEDLTDHEAAGARSDLEMFFETAAWKMHREVSQFDGTFFISVDLGATDDFLVKEFKSWIKRTRRDAGIKPLQTPFTMKDFSRWHNQRLLPYLDLTFWADTQLKSFAHEEIGRALFSGFAEGRNEQGKDDRMRRTIAKNALEIVSEECVSALNAQLRALKRTPAR